MLIASPCVNEGIFDEISRLNNSPQREKLLFSFRSGHFDKFISCFTSHQYCKRGFWVKQI